LHIWACTRTLPPWICIAPLPGPTPGQIALAEALGRGEAALGTESRRWTPRFTPISARFEAEQRAIFDRLPHLLAPSALLPDPNTAIAHDHYGTPLIISRDASGQAHVLANVCRHRGTRLIEELGVVPAKRIVCPYHAWAYKPDGQLTGCRAPNASLGLDEDALGLVHYPCVEAGGLIWFAKRPDADFSEVLALAPDLMLSRWPTSSSTARERTRWLQTGSSSSTPSSKAITSSASSGDHR
jgi:phenylpropionate dioxygenase-like ring-hydroxylating dioxygenase large terminal subunit